jgi:hypothetical protein
LYFFLKVLLHVVHFSCNFLEAGAAPVHFFLCLAKDVLLMYCFMQLEHSKQLASLRKIAKVNYIMHILGGCVIWHTAKLLSIFYHCYNFYFKANEE